MSIVTKTGDQGETSLMYGRRVQKNDSRVEAYGSVDELTAALGLARAICDDKFVADQIFAAQKELINVMGELATLPEDRQRYVKDGFKENVIMGHLIPAGTGFPAHREVRLVEKGEPIGAPAMDEAELQPAIG